MCIRTIIAALTLAILPAGADVLSFDLTSSSLNAPAGTSTTLEFAGTLTNPTSAVVFLNGDGSFLDQSMTLDDSPFLTLAPLSLAAGGTYSGPFFDVMVFPTTLSGTYAGTFTIQGGADENAFDNLATANFTVNVTGATVPEPQSSALLLVALAVLAALHRRRCQQAESARAA